MARAAKKKDDAASEVKVMDFDRVRSIYFNDYKPSKSKSSSEAQGAAEAMKVIKKACHVEPQGARKAFSAFEMEDAMQEIHIRSFVGTYNALRGEEVLTCNFGDLVDQAEGKGGDGRRKPNLVAVPAKGAGEDNAED